MNKSTALADFLMLPFSLLAKAAVMTYGLLMRLAVLAVPVLLIVGIVLLANRLLNLRRRP